MSNVMFLVAVGVFAQLCSQVRSHSWLDCADWDALAGKCRGWARNFNKRPSVPLGQDVGRDIRPGKDVPEGLVCDEQKEKINSPATAGYSQAYPMAVVAPGQKLVWRWPAKNHADVGTQRGVQLFISKGPGLGDDFSHIASKAAWLAKHPGLTHTFSNCYQGGAKVGPNVDRAECFGTFELPAELAAGIYTFIWWWEFNGGEYYNSCADVRVVENSNGGVPLLTPSIATPMPTPLLTGSPFSPAPTTPLPDSSGSGLGSGSGSRSVSCPVLGHGLPACVSECYCGFTGVDGSGCGVDDGSSCWCKCCCHFRGGCAYRLPDQRDALSSASVTSIPMVVVASVLCL